MWVSGGGISPNPSIRTLSNNFNHGVSLFFKITALTSDLTLGDSTYSDSTISLIAEIGINTSSKTTIFEQTDAEGDKSSSHIKSGFPALFINLDGRESTATDAIKFKDIKVQKAN
ncbi:MAG: hypothetical protein MUF22_00435 [Chitinispirillaceae bacterium]|jgi:hypothetical protein|nr:hypothetical protein [Chitinispirillaceae bacterium]